MKKKSRSLINSCRRGGVVQENLLITPPRPLHLKVASLLFLYVAAPPPPAEEGCLLRHLSKLSGNLGSSAAEESRGKLQSSESPIRY
jgi:hypothetical protein